MHVLSLKLQKILATHPLKIHTPISWGFGTLYQMPYLDGKTLIVKHLEI